MWSVELFATHRVRVQKKQNNPANDPMCAYAYITLDDKIKNAI